MIKVSILLYLYLYLITYAVETYYIWLIKGTVSYTWFIVLILFFWDPYRDLCACSGFKNHIKDIWGYILN